MAGKSLDAQVQEGLSLLPKDGAEMEFNEFKKKLYDQNAGDGRAAFEWMLKNGLVRSTVYRNPDKTYRTMLSIPK